MKKEDLMFNIMKYKKQNMKEICTTTIKIYIRKVEVRW